MEAMTFGYSEALPLSHRMSEFAKGWQPARRSEKRQDKSGFTGINAKQTTTWKGAREIGRLQPEKNKSTGAGSDVMEGSLARRGVTFFHSGGLS
jgi:hypothetical protein